MHRNNMVGIIICLSDCFTFLIVVGEEAAGFPVFFSCAVLELFVSRRSFSARARRCVHQLMLYRRLPSVCHGPRPQSPGWAVIIWTRRVCHPPDHPPAGTTVPVCPGACSSSPFLPADTLWGLLVCTVCCPAVKCTAPHQARNCSFQINAAPPGPHTTRLL